MPVALSYPGVYVEEIKSGVRTITGVSTSIAAFVGRAPRGASDDPVTINSFGDYQRSFGGLALDYPLGFAVRDFFQNGGSQAIVVRVLGTPETASTTNPAPGKAAVGLLKPTAEAETAAKDEAAAIIKAAEVESTTAKAAAATAAAAAVAAAAAAAAPTSTAAAKKQAADATAASVAAAAKSAAIDAALTAEKARVAALAGSAPTLPNLEASSEGAWGNNLAAVIDYMTKEKVELGKDRTLFNLTIYELEDQRPVRTEQFFNVAFEPSNPRYLPRVLDQESSLVRVTRQADGSWAAFTLPDSSVAPNKAAVAPSQPTTTKGKEGVNGSATLRKDDLIGHEDDKKGIYALEKADLFNILCLPPDTVDGNVSPVVVGSAAVYCQKRRALLLVDPPSSWKNAAGALKGFIADPGVGTRSSNAALFFPRLRQPNPLSDNQLEDFVPCGAVAGIFARTDVTRGVWKAPAGVDATLVGVPQLAVSLTDAENGQLNPVAINCLRSFPVYGRVVWGSRTLAGADILSDDYKYIPVRRLALYMEESLFRGSKWVVFEPNDEPLWAQIRLNFGAFMHNLFRQGAFQGTTPRDAYFVKCDKETTTQNDINLGIVNIVVGFAPLKPAEFVVIKLQQIAGQIDV